MGFVEEEKGVMVGVVEGYGVEGVGGVGGKAESVLEGVLEI